jgi:uncharacterized membrane protein
MMKYKKGPAALYSHEQDRIINPNQVFKEKLTFGQKLADSVSQVMGGWYFIAIQSIIICIWIAANLYWLSTQKAFDPYPFILLNLAMSFQAAYSTPIIMMSQNRQGTKDRLTAELDYNINKKTERETRIIMEHLIYQDHMMQELKEEFMQKQKIRETYRLRPKLPKKV